MCKNLHIKWNVVYQEGAKCQPEPGVSITQEISGTQRFSPFTPPSKTQANGLIYSLPAQSTQTARPPYPSFQSLSSP